MKEAPAVKAVENEQEEKSFLALGGKVSVRRDLAAPGRPIIGLALGGKKITDAVLKEITELKSLQTLDLYMCTLVTEAGLKELKILQNLKELNLVGTQVTEVGLKEMKELKSLQSLDLTDSGVTDAGLKELKELKSLRNLGLYGSKVTDAGVNELRVALPQLTIHRPSSPSAQPPAKSEAQLVGKWFLKFDMNEITIDIAADGTVKYDYKIGDKAYSLKAKLKDGELRIDYGNGMFLIYNVKYREDKLILSAGNLKEHEESQFAKVNPAPLVAPAPPAPAPKP